MIDDFMHVLENHHDANLHSESARRNIAEALREFDKLNKQIWE